MSFADNPYSPTASPSRTDSPLAYNQYPDGYYRPVSRFDTIRFLKSPFTSPNWMMNILCMVVCDVLAIFVIGSVIALGYNMIVAEARTGGRDKNWPDFDFNNFSDYLMRGLWPFLWNLIGSFFIAIVLLVPFIVTAVLAANLNAANQWTTIGVLVACIGGFITLGIGLSASIAMFASMIHSGLGNDFMKGADIGWISSFVSKMFWQTILVGIILTAVAIGGSILGTLFFCVGLVLVGPILRLMSSDAIAQVHDMFVSRGGRPACPVPTIPGPANNGDVIDAKVIF